MKRFDWSIRVPIDCVLILAQQLVEEISGENKTKSSVSTALDQDYTVHPISFCHCHRCLDSRRLLLNQLIHWWNSYVGKKVTWMY